MKKYIVILVGMIAINAAAHAQNDFRGFAWGNGTNKIQQEESATLTNKIKNNELVYQDVLGGADCNVFYIFNDDDKLESGMYIFTKKYSNPQLYLQDYEAFKSLLLQKYGQPISEKESWANNTKAAEKHNYGQAIADGDLSLHTVWNTDRSVIQIILVHNSDKQPVLQIHYTARSLDELQNKAVLQSALKKL
ncbi:MAG: hypothetical protein QM802_20960 [Agriterribacter sp.]